MVPAGAWTGIDESVLKRRHKKKPDVSGGERRARTIRSETLRTFLILLSLVSSPGDLNTWGDVYSPVF